MGYVTQLQIQSFAAYLRFVRRTSSVRVERSVSGSALVPIWHDAMGTVLAATVGMRDVGVYVRAQPGIEDTLELLRILGVRTFLSDVRSPAMLREARAWLEVPGRLLTVTLDYGVPRTASPAVARLARLLRVPLHPLEVTASSGFRLDGWDRCVVPHPASRLIVRMLEKISTDDAPSKSAQAIERAMPGATLDDAARPAHVRRALEAWPRLCLMPVSVGRLRLGPS